CALLPAPYRCGPDRHQYSDSCPGGLVQLHGIPRVQTGRPWPEWQAGGVFLDTNQNGYSALVGPCRRRQYHDLDEVSVRSRSLCCETRGTCTVSQGSGTSLLASGKVCAYERDVN